MRAGKCHVFEVVFEIQYMYLYLKYDVKIVFVFEGIKSIYKYISLYLTPSLYNPL